jgi:hypothetical protein
MEELHCRKEQIDALKPNSCFNEDKAICNVLTALRKRKDGKTDAVFPSKRSASTRVKYQCARDQSFRWRLDGIFSILRYFVTVRRATG